MTPAVVYYLATVVGVSVPIDAGLEDVLSDLRGVLTGHFEVRPVPELRLPARQRA